MFLRHELSDKKGPDGEEELQVQVQNTKLGIATFWSLEKFQNNLAAMRELEQVQHRWRRFTSFVNNPSNN